MKVSTLLQTALLAMSIAGAAQAITPAARKAAGPNSGSPHVIELDQSHCANHGAPENCSMIPAEADKHGVQDNEAAQHVKAKGKEDLPAAVPEPKTFLMMMLGLVVLGFASARRGSYEKFSD